MKTCDTPTEKISTKNIYDGIYDFNADKYEYDKWIRKADTQHDISVYFFKNLIA